MAKVIQKIVHGQNKYDWDKWANGQIWQVIKGEDFEGSAESLRYTIYSYARREKLKAKVSVKKIDHRGERVDAVEFRIWKANGTAKSKKSKPSPKRRRS